MLLFSYNSENNNNFFLFMIQSGDSNDYYYADNFEGFNIHIVQIIIFIVSAFVVGSPFRNIMVWYPVSQCSVLQQHPTLLSSHHCSISASSSVDHALLTLHFWCLSRYTKWQSIDSSLYRVQAKWWTKWLCCEYYSILTGIIPILS